ncbi:MAG: hypothetical protein INQ03_18945 [Candidatus Heimdallarchaeota archaeon]|nr:hypothetical protein [Candidatus Heimdallarchaeota archaeon]
MTPLEQIDDIDEFKLLVDEYVNLVVMFTGLDSAATEKLEPLLEELREAMNLPIYKVNVWNVDFIDMEKECEVFNLPCLLFFKSGLLVSKTSGYKERHELSIIFKQLIELEEEKIELANELALTRKKLIGL